MTIKVDARGMGCPKPVIMTKNAIEAAGKDSIITIVDNEVAMENVKKLAAKLNFNVEIEKKDGDFYLSIFKDGSCAEAVEEATNDIGDWAILVCDDKLGAGAEALGNILIKGYFYALTESKPYPKAILFMNCGINLTVEGSESLEHIKTLEDKGVEILSCGTCLDFYDLKSKLMVGNVSNMYTMVEKMNEATKVVRI